MVILTTVEIAKIRKNSKNFLPLPSGDQINSVKSTEIQHVKQKTDKTCFR